MIGVILLKQRLIRLSLIQNRHQLVRRRTGASSVVDGFRRSRIIEVCWKEVKLEASHGIGTVIKIFELLCEICFFGFLYVVTVRCKMSIYRHGMV